MSAYLEARKIFSKNIAYIIAQDLDNLEMKNC